ncbi:hypothetical protein TNCV_4344031 [Trichonephila clavipes]|nr:hypothetical protein TNCV_4344031 [Trichonephila clavipes]
MKSVAGQSSRWYGVEVWIIRHNLACCSCHLTGSFKIVRSIPSSTVVASKGDANKCLATVIFEASHFRFVEWAQNEIAVVPDFHKRILFSDEAHFWLNGYVNKQNCRIWREANPQVYVETPLHPEKLTVWCALWAGGILLQKRCRPQRYSQW